MKELILLLAEFTSETIRDKDWYRWRTIDESKIPCGIKIEGQNEYYKNLDLKNKLSDVWNNPNTSKDDKFKLVKYYISTWGGIPKNSHKKLEEYASSTEDNIISLGKHGIASWSKALCIRDPKKFAIYDARVAAALNFIQIHKNTDFKYAFPLLPSRNTKITNGNCILKSAFQDWDKNFQIDFYEKYIELLQNVVLELDVKNIFLSTVEMVLFAKSIELADFKT